MKYVGADIFDRKSVSRARRELNKALKRFEKMDEIVKRIAEVGYEVAKKGFDAPTEANYQGTDVRLFKNSNGNYTIYAFGQQVCYVEFGAGVKYGNVIPYDGYVPLEIDPIGYHNTKDPGEPSKGQNMEWTYPHGKTSGIMAYQPMNFALHKMRQEAPKIIAEVLSKGLK